MKSAIDKNNQHITCCGVGAHHQNGVAERHIRTIVEKARTSLLHASTKWPSAEIDTELTFAVNLAVYQWNHTPRRDLHYLCPEEAFTGIKKPLTKPETFRKLFHPFGCPVLVLETALQNGQSLPKFDPRCRMGVYLGHSSEHASNVALVLNPKTGIISNQYHLVFDDKFKTISTESFTKTSQLALWDDVSKRLNAVESNPCISFSPESFNPKQTTNIQDLNNMSSSQSAESADRDCPLISDSTSTDKESPATPSPTECNINNPPYCGRSQALEQAVSTVSASRRLPYILDPTRKSTSFPTNTNPKRRSNRQRKRSQKVQDAISHIHAMAAAFAASSKHLPFSERIAQLLNLSALQSGAINELDPLAFAASANPNILTHREAMKAKDIDQFLAAMQEELERMDDNEIYEEVLRSSVPKGRW